MKNVLKITTNTGIANVPVQKTFNKKKDRDGTTVNLYYSISNTDLKKMGITGVDGLVITKKSEYFYNNDPDDVKECNNIKKISDAIKYFDEEGDEIEYISKKFNKIDNILEYMDRNNIDYTLTNTNESRLPLFENFVSGNRNNETWSDYYERNFTEDEIRDAHDYYVDWCDKNNQTPEYGDPDFVIGNTAVLDHVLYHAEIEGYEIS